MRGREGQILFVQGDQILFELCFASAAGDFQLTNCIVSNPTMHMREKGQRGQKQKSAWAQWYRSVCPRPSVHPLLHKNAHTRDIGKCACCPCRVQVPIPSIPHDPGHLRVSRR